MRNLKKLSNKELTELINTTTDVKLLELAEEEYINRSVRNDDVSDTMEDDIWAEVRKIYREHD